MRMRRIMLLKGGTLSQHMSNQEDGGMCKGSLVSRVLGLVLLLFCGHHEDCVAFLIFLPSLSIV